MDFWWRMSVLSWSASFALSTDNACPFIMDIFRVWGCIPLYTSMQKSKEVCDSVLVKMMNMYYPHCPFPSRKWRASYQRLWELQSQPNNTSAQGVNFHRSFPIKFSIAPGKFIFFAALR
jgi:hypothetical protein